MLDGKGCRRKMTFGGFVGVPLGWLGRGRGRVRRECLAMCEAVGRGSPGAISIPNARSLVATVDYYIDKDTNEEFVEWWIDDAVDVAALSVLVVSFIGAFVSLVVLGKNVRDLFDVVQANFDEERIATSTAERLQSKGKKLSRLEGDLEALAAQRDLLRNDVSNVTQQMNSAYARLQQLLDLLFSSGAYWSQLY